MQGHNAGVWCLQGVGYQVWSGSGDKTIRIWSSEVITNFIFNLIFLFNLKNRNHYNQRQIIHITHRRNDLHHQLEVHHQFQFQ